MNPHTITHVVLYFAIVAVGFLAAAALHASRRLGDAARDKTRWLDNDVELLEGRVDAAESELIDLSHYAHCVLGTQVHRHGHRLKELGVRFAAHEAASEAQSETTGGIKRRCDGFDRSLGLIHAHLIENAELAGAEKGPAATGAAGPSIDSLRSEIHGYSELVRVLSRQVECQRKTLAGHAARLIEVGQSIVTCSGRIADHRVVLSALQEGLEKVRPGQAQALNCCLGLSAVTGQGAVIVGPVSARVETGEGR